MLPAMTLLVPAMVIFIIGLGYFMWVAIADVVLTGTVFFWMRHITKRDDQRLLQLLLQWKLRFKYRNRGHWQCVSYTPWNYRPKGRYLIAEVSASIFDRNHDGKRTHSRTSTS